jgi:trk system potassium uptake protein TrkA
VGHRVSRLEQESGVRVAFLTRYGEGLLPNADTVVQADDVVHVMLDPARRAEHVAVFARGPEVR